MARALSSLPRWMQQEWVADAACAGQTALFFPPFGEQPDARAAREAVAREICLRCPVILPCREYARRNREHGFWGGESDEDRLQARRRVGHSVGRSDGAGAAPPFDSRTRRSS